MQSSKIEKDVKKTTENFDKDNFIYDFLSAYGFTKMMIERLRGGNSNLSKKDNQVIIKRKLFYESIEKGDLYSIIDNLKNESTTYTHKPRFIIVNNSEKLLAIDTKTKENLDTTLVQLHENIDFFLPLTGKEKYIAHQENPADVKAAERMARIYDEIVKENTDLTANNNHALNIFLTRLLFCFFAEDTGIFEDGIFTETISNHTSNDGSDLSEFLDRLFVALDAEDKTNYPVFMQKFPYVNGNLFTDRTIMPVLSSKVRNLIIECGGQDWKEINPDIFGSMFQAAATAEVRSVLGQHYTSVPNIMKVIEPLFLNILREEYEKADNEKKLRKLLDRIYNLKIFDPACGSGNFLIIAYKQLRLLEMDIIQKIFEVTGQKNLMLSSIQLNQFYGIEIDGFACEIARLSLWLAEHQMNRKFKALFGDCNPTLPLKATGQIVCGNATRLDWEDVCPKGVKGLTKKQMQKLTLNELQNMKISEIQGSNPEIYILGNPPYLGARLQSDSQKNDMTCVFNNCIDGYNNLDYISCWFKKATDYILGSNAYFAFVTTNSICQGSQVSLLWKYLLSFNVEISFAHQSFKWTNNAKSNAGVTVAIIGVRNKNSDKKYLITNGIQTEVKNINGYLIDRENTYVVKKQKTLSKFPKISFGSMPNDGGFLILSETEKEDLLSKDANIQRFIKNLLGSQEFIRGEKRYCIWISDDDIDEINNYPEIISRINSVKQYRLNSKRAATNKLADEPYRFGEVRYKSTNCIIIPRVSAERREYIPCGFLDKNTVISDSALAIYDAEPWVFGVVTSRMHMTWVRAVAGKLETRLRYSAELCYNTFPFPDISDKQKKVIEMHVNEVLAEREKHSEKTMAELYDPDKMPDGLRKAHHDLDIAIELCYPKCRFDSDEQRLKYLFKMYGIMTNPSKSNDRLEQLSLL